MFAKILLPTISRIKIIVFIICLLPFFSLVMGIMNDSLGANPVEFTIRSLGEWGLRLLLLTLAITPVRIITGKTILVRFRRLLGLFSFFYICLHWLLYIVLEQSLDWNEIWFDIIERPFITVGMIAFTLMLMLAVTSSRAMMKRLGRNWQRLHRMVYVAAIFAVLHYFWLVKADIRLPLLYLIILLVLLGFRLVRYLTQRYQRPECLSENV